MYVGNARVGNNVKIQNNVSVYDAVVLEDDVFCGPSMVFTNVINPRSHIPRKSEYKADLGEAWGDDRGQRGDPLRPHDWEVCHDRRGRSHYQRCAGLRSGGR